MIKHITMKEIPSSEQPYEKCLKYGAKVLSDGELLAVILRTGSRNKSSIELAREILNCHPVHKGILGLHYLSIEDYRSLSGIGTVKAVQLCCLSEITKRISKACVKEQTIFHSPKAIADYFMEELRCLEEEHFYAIFLDAKSAMIHVEQISKGTVNQTLVAPREIFRCALKYNTVNIVLMHNHPSGNITPSKDDLSITSQMKQAGELLGIPVIDHIIMGDHKYLSLRESGYI